MIRANPSLTIMLQILAAYSAGIQSLEYLAMSTKEEVALQMGRRRLLQIVNRLYEQLGTDPNIGQVLEGLL